MKRQQLPPRAVVFDNGGETFDRYTIVTPDGNVYGASQDPFHPQGFGQYSHNVADQYSDQLRPSAAERKRILRRALSGYLTEARGYFTNKGQARRPFGKEIYNHAELPEPVQRYITQLMAEVAAE